MFKTCTVYKLDILTSMKAFNRIWEAFPSNIASNCWVHTKLRLVSKHYLTQSSGPTLLEEELCVLENQVSSLVPAHA